MKKIFSSTLVFGILFLASSPVFAADIDGESGIEANGSVPVTTAVTATYTVNIPASLAIDLTDPSTGLSDKGTITLSELTAAGTVAVVPTTTNLTLTGATNPVETGNQSIVITVVDGADADLAGFSLSNAANTQSIGAKTTETSSENLPGTYTGAINFTFNYVPEAATVVTP